VDASVGGKNGVNLDAFKNMIGVFAQPEFVLCDLALLSTLPAPEISNGFAEIVKHGLISDPDLFSFLEANVSKARKLDESVIFRLVSDSVRIKSEVVQADEKESGDRRKLNFGHTLGHAMEKISPTGHGQAVSRGMIAALLFSQERYFLQTGVLDRTTRLIESLGLPVTLDFKVEDMIAAVARDKKKENNDLFFIFLEQIGCPRIEKVSLEELNQWIQTAFQ
jgi:3-dehydroquinate synthase